MLDLLRLPVVLLALATCLPGCVSSSPLAPIPVPLPETLEWARPAGDGAFLGLQTEENDSGSLDALFFDPGARVLSVVQNSPAAAAGLAVGDIVLALEDREVADPAALDALVSARAPGSTVTLRVQRGDTVFAVPVVLSGRAASGERPAILWRRDPARSRAGWATAPGGVLLASAAPDSPFPRDGVPMGSVVSALDGRGVLSDRELLRELAARAPGSVVEVSFRAAGAQDEPLRTTRVRLVEQPTRIIESGVAVLWSYEAAPDSSRSKFTLLDLWVLQLFRYEREGGERRYRLLPIFGWAPIRWSTGVGMLAE